MRFLSLCVMVCLLLTNSFNVSAAEKSEWLSSSTFSINDVDMTLESAQVRLLNHGWYIEHESDVITYLTYPDSDAYISIISNAYCHGISISENEICVELEFGNISFDSTYDEIIDLLGSDFYWESNFDNRRYRVYKDTDQYLMLIFTNTYLTGLQYVTVREDFVNGSI